MKKIVNIGGLSLLAVMILSCNTLKMHGFGGYGEMLSISPENIVIDSFNSGELQKKNFTALFNSMEKERFEESAGTGSRAEVRVRINELSFIKDSSEVFPETVNSIIIEIKVFDGGTLSAGYTLIDTTTESLASPGYMEKVIGAILEQLHG